MLVLLGAMARQVTAEAGVADTAYAVADEGFGSFWLRV